MPRRCWMIVIMVMMSCGIVFAEDNAQEFPADFDKNLANKVFFALSKNMPKAIDELNVSFFFSIVDEYGHTLQSNSSQKNKLDRKWRSHDNINFEFSYDNGQIKAFARIPELGNKYCHASIEILFEKKSELWLVKSFIFEEEWKIGEALDVWLQRLQDKDPDKRVLAAGMLGIMGDTKAAPALKKALYDKDEQVRADAAWALGEIGDESAVPIMLDILINRTEKFNYPPVYYHHNFETAIEMIGRSGIPAMIEALRADLEEIEEIGVECMLRDILQQIGGSSIPELAKILNDKDEKIRNFAAYVLGHIKDKRAVRALIEAFKCEDDNFAWKITRALIQLGEFAVPELINTVKNTKHNYTRFWAFFALEWIIRGNKEIFKPLVPIFVGLLDEKDEKARRYAYSVLSSLGDETHLPILKKMLEDKDEYFRESAMNRLCIIKPPDIVSILNKLLKDKSPHVRRAAAERFREIEGKAAIETLTDILKNDEDDSVRYAAIRTLGDIKDKSTITVLVESLQDRNCDIRKYSAEMLGGMGDKSVIPALLKLTQDESVVVRFAAASSICKLGDASKLNIITDKLSDKDSRISLEARRSLGNSGKLAIPVLLDILHNGHGTLRYDAACALGDIGDKSVIPALVEALKDKDTRYGAAYSLTKFRKESIPALEETLRLRGYNYIPVQKEAIEILGRIGGEKVINILAGLLECGGELCSLSFAAKEALENIGKPAVPTLISCLKQKNIGTILQAVRLLGKMREITAIPHLAKLLGHDDEGFRHEVVDALANIGDKTAVPVLINSLELEKNPYQRRNIIRALEKINDPSAIPVLIKILQEKDPEDRCSAICALENIGDKSVIPDLVKMLKDENLYVQIDAVASLGKVGDGSVIPLLEPFLQSSDRNMRRTAINALGAIGDKKAIPSLLKCLADANRGNCWCAAYALENITQQRFSLDPAKWQEWWKANKDRILKEEAEKEKTEKDKVDK